MADVEASAYWSGFHAHLEKVLSAGCLAMARYAGLVHVPDGLPRTEQDHQGPSLPSNASSEPASFS